MKKYIFLLLAVAFLLITINGALAFSQDDAVLVSNTRYCKDNCELVIDVVQKDEDKTLGKNNEKIEYKVKDLKSKSEPTTGITWMKHTGINKIPVYEKVKYDYDCKYTIDNDKDTAICFDEVVDLKNGTSYNITYWSGEYKKIKDSVISYEIDEIVDYKEEEFEEWIGESSKVKNLRLYVDDELFNGNFDDKKVTKIWKKGETHRIKITGSLKDNGGQVDMIPSLFGIDITKFAVWESIPATDLQSGNVAYFAFDETGQNYSTELIGAPEGDVGVINGAYKFDGTNDWLSTADSSIYDTQTFSVCCWANISDPTTRFTPMSKWWDGSKRQFYTSLNRKCTGSSCPLDAGWIQFSIGYSENVVHVVQVDVGSALLNNGKFHHYCFTNNHGSMKIFMNGTQVASANTGYTMLYNSEPLLIGSGSQTGSIPIKGNIDDARFYNKTINSSEVSCIYNYGSGTESENCAGDNLIYHLTMNGLNDSTPNDNFLTGVGGVTNAEGKINEAFEFDGTDYLNAGDWIDEFWNNGATIGFWQNITDMTDTGYIISKKSSGANDGWYWALNLTEFSFHQDFSTTDGKWELSLANFTENKWSYVTIVYNASSVANDPIIYVNGVDAGAVETQTPVGTARYTSTTDFTIGDRMAGDAGVKAVIDEFSAWDRSLTSDEVLWLNDSRNQWTYDVSSNTAPSVVVNYPANGSLTYRVLNPLLNFTITDDSALVYSYVYYANGTLICADNNSVSDTITCQIPTQPSNELFSYYIFLNDTELTSNSSFEFTPNDEPRVENFRIENISDSIFVEWDNEADMSWMSHKIEQADIQEVRSLVGSTHNNWTIETLYPNSVYDYVIQIGDNLSAMSDYYTFQFMTTGWPSDLYDFGYKNLITINSSDVGTDGLKAINISLTDETFRYYDSTNYVYYPAFSQLNWTNGNDLRFKDYHQVNNLTYNITYWNVPGDGGVSTQTIPDSVSFTGGWLDTAYAYDNNWNSDAIPNTFGSYYANYSVPAGAKNTSKIRIYSGNWYWDGDFPDVCLQTDTFQLRADSNYTAQISEFYCKQGDGNWNNFWNSTSHLIYETMITWFYNCRVDITVMPYHWDDTTQNFTEGTDGDYDTKFYMYYGNPTSTSGSSEVTYSSLIQTFSMDSQEEYVEALPVISNLNTSGATASTINVTFDVDQITDNIVYYTTHPALLNKLTAWYLVNVTEYFEHVYGDIEQEHDLQVHSAEWVSVVNVSCSNASLSGNYTINSSTGNAPVTLTFADSDDANYNDWNITYTENRSWYRETGSPNIYIEGLADDTIYYYQALASSTVGNTTADGTFTLGTPPSTPTTVFVNYSEDRPNKQVTICFNLTNMNGCSAINASIEYWNDTSDISLFTSLTAMGAIGTYCKTINVTYGYNYSYRGTAQCTTTGYSDTYTNEFMSVQEFFAGNPTEDDNDDLDRQYCAGGVGTTPCYEQKGYREGSQQEETWIYIETNLSNTDTLTVKWWNGSSWVDHTMNNDTSDKFQYLTLTELDDEWQTFYIVDSSNSVVLNWTKPSLVHTLGENRTDEYKYVSFGITKTAIDYMQMYIDWDVDAYNTTAYRWCMNQPGGDLFTCMNVQYWGGGIESGITSDLGGFSYDRGQLFRGGIVNGEPYDTAILNDEFTAINRLPGNDQPTGSNERFCYAFVDSYHNTSVAPTNNITSFYVHRWSQTQRYSDYLGYAQDVTFDHDGLFKWEYDQVSGTRDWGVDTANKILTPRYVLNTSNETFSSSYNQTLIIGFKYDALLDVSTNVDDWYQTGFQTDGTWNNIQINKYQRAFVIYNLPDNATLAGLDTDSDGLNDYDELFVYYTDPRTNDTDGGGRTDYDEIILGKDVNIYSDDNYVPFTSSAQLLPATMYTNSTANCSGYYNDTEGDSGTVWVQWYLNQTANKTTSKLVDDGDFFNFTMDSGNFSKNTNVTCEIWVGDGTLNSSKTNYTKIVANTAPNGTIVWYAPLSGDIYNTLTGSPVLMNWSAVTDVDGDTITYIVEYNYSNGDGSYGWATATNTTDTNFSEVISNFITADYIYRVTPSDGTDSGTAVETDSFVIEAPPASGAFGGGGGGGEVVVIENETVGNASLGNACLVDIAISELNLDDDDFTYEVSNRAGTNVSVELSSMLGNLKLDEYNQKIALRYPLLVDGSPELLINSEGCEETIVYPLKVDNRDLIVSRIIGATLVLLLSMLSVTGVFLGLKSLIEASVSGRKPPKS